MKKSLRVANAEAARILLIQAYELHKIAFDKLKEAYPNEFPREMGYMDTHPHLLACFAVEQLSKEGEI
jgi:hypothetical protein